MFRFEEKEASRLGFSHCEVPEKENDPPSRVASRKAPIDS